MVNVLVHRDGVTARADGLDPAWLAPESGAVVWVDIEDPDEADRRLLSEVFRFHELSIEDALAEVHYPKIETYDGYLYLILHGVNAGAKHGFVTQDVDFFLAPRYLVTVRRGASRSIDASREVCLRHGSVLAEGPAALLHRIIDRMVDNYRPAVEGLEDQLDALEQQVFKRPDRNPVRRILDLKRDLAGLRRITLPERDAVGRLARREFPDIGDQLAYRFRDVYDNLARLADEAIVFQDRVTGLLDAHLASQSNRVNQVMKVLTVIATIFMPLTVLTGLYGMNVGLPAFPGGGAGQFWWIVGLMAVVAAVMLWMFRRKEWL